MVLGVTVNLADSLSDLGLSAETVDWEVLSCNDMYSGELSELFMETYADKLNWIGLSVHQHLSEDLIEKYSDRVDWGLISEYQPLSEEFIERHKDDVLWELIHENKDVSEEFKKKHVRGTEIGRQM